VTGPQDAPAVRRASWNDLDPRTLHDLVSLRIDVFVVEQACAYPELDGRDVEPGTEHVWTADEKGPTAYLRVLTDPDGEARVGRVCTRADARGAGLAARLLADVLARTGDRAVVLDAQEHLAGWYARFGFAPTGPRFVEDGIPHVPMRRAAGAAR
jgi:ElaA protein